MIKKIFYILLLLCPACYATAQGVWQQLTLPSYAQMAAQFKNYPVEYGETLTWGWDGEATGETITHDLDAIKQQGLHVVTIECGYNMGVDYLSTGWFEKVKIAVEEARKRNMRVWIIDEGKYPSGFAGGLISKEAPEYRMQGIVVNRVRLKDNESITGRQLSPNVISAVAVNEAGDENKIVDVSNGLLSWVGQTGNWQIILAEHRYKTSVTRAATNPTRGKDTVNSLIDYLNPAATAKFIEFTHEQYKKCIGDEFGKTVLGFRGDEPEFNFTPWSPRLPEIFKQKKGYDIRPYIASFFLPRMNEKQKLAKADFWDVWSALFCDNFFKVQADWCSANNMEYMVHLNHEDKLMDLARTGGDYFKTMRYVQVPGVDAIWNQIWYDKISDFPKLASSAAHMYGRPRALSESFAAYNPRPTVEDARWVVNQQLVRGINLFEYMFWPASSGGRSRPSGYLSDSLFPALATYSNRASFLLSNGRPAAQIGLYMPTESMWLGDENANAGLLKIAKQLSETQLDYDFVDEQGLGSLFTLQNGRFKNLSGQIYSAIIVPSVTVLSEAVIKRLQEFKQQGGEVIFAGVLPDLIAGRTFLKAKNSPSLNWAAHYNSDSLPAEALRKLPADVVLDGAYPSVKYLHRKWKDADLYFFFNESKTPVSVNAHLEGKGIAHVWSAETGDMTAAARNRTSHGDRVTIPLAIDGYESKFIVLAH